MSYKNLGRSLNTVQLCLLNNFYIYLTLYMADSFLLPWCSIEKYDQNQLCDHQFFSFLSFHRSEVTIFMMVSCFHIKVDNYSADQNVSCFYGIWTSNSVFMVVHHWTCSEPIESIHISIHCLHFNIFLPSSPRCSKWSLPLRLAEQNIVIIFHFSHACLCTAYLIPLDLLP